MDPGCRRRSHPPLRPDREERRDRAGEEAAVRHPERRRGACRHRHRQAACLRHRRPLLRLRVKPRNPATIPHCARTRNRLPPRTRRRTAADRLDACPHHPCPTPTRPSIRAPAPLPVARQRSRCRQPTDPPVASERGFLFRERAFRRTVAASTEPGPKCSQRLTDPEASRAITWEPVGGRVDTAGPAGYIGRPRRGPQPRPIDLGH
jgi:hypothetical protein